MRTSVVKGVLVLMLCWVVIGMPTRAAASEWPMVPGDFWEVTGIHIKDGGALAYANFLASEWKANQDFAKSKGWIKAYMILYSAFARKGEPNLYLIVVSERLPSGPESEKRDDEYMAWRKKTEAQLQKESGNRIEIREVGSSMLLQELKFR
jgi:hypothetical protein